MENPMNQQKDLSGTNYYSYKGEIVELSPTFLYEISLYKLWKGGAASLGTKYYKADHLLNIKKSLEIKELEDGHIEKSITLVGVPQEFINEYNLKPYERSKRSNRRVC